MRNCLDNQPRRLIQKKTHLSPPDWRHFTKFPTFANNQLRGNTLKIAPPLKRGKPPLIFHTLFQARLPVALKKDRSPFCLYPFGPKQRGREEDSCCTCIQVCFIQDSVFSPLFYVQVEIACPHLLGSHLLRCGQLKFLKRNLPIANVALNPYLALFVTKHRHVLEMLRSYTRVARFQDVVWYDLSVTFTTRRPHT